MMSERDEREQRLAYEKVLIHAMQLLRSRTSVAATAVLLGSHLQPFQTRNSQCFETEQNKWRDITRDIHFFLP